MPCSTAQRDTIRRAYLHLPDNRHVNRIHQLCLEGERRHRKPIPGWPNRAPRGFSADLAAQYLTCKWLRDALQRTEPVRPREALRVKPECFLAHALADDPEFRPELDKWAAGLAPTFADLDYVKLMG